MDKIVKEGLTFDDVLLIPAKSDVVPKDVSLKTRLTANIELNIPLVSAAMDTVTESKLAIAIAREGGLGIIHKNMTIDEQVEQVDKVKRSENGVINDPFSLSRDHKLTDALALMQKYRISGVPITEKNGKLVGILTNRDLRFETNFDRPIDEVMTKDNLITAREGTTLEEAKRILADHRIEKLPIVDKDFKLNIEANHATLAGHTFEHDLRVAAINGMLGSVDANQGDFLLGWDTDEFPYDVYTATKAMYEILKAGGLTGGFNFDAKNRRPSYTVEDMFKGYILGMDTFALGLIKAAAIIEDGRLDKFVENKYASFRSGVGKKITDRKTSLAELAAYADGLGAPALPGSGNQEGLESIFNQILFS